MTTKSMDDVQNASYDAECVARGAPHSGSESNLYPFCGRRLYPRGRSVGAQNGGGTTMETMDTIHDREELGTIVLEECAPQRLSHR